MYFLDKKTSQKDSDAFRLLIDIGELIYPMLISNRNASESFLACLFV